MLTCGYGLLRKNAPQKGDIMPQRGGVEGDGGGGRGGGEGARMRGGSVYPYSCRLSIAVMVLMRLPSAIPG